MRKAAWYAALALVAAVALLRISADLRAIPYRYAFSRGSDSGEALIHCVRFENGALTSRVMPMLSLMSAVLFTHDGGLMTPQTAISSLVLATGVLLVAVTGSLTPAAVYALSFFHSSDLEETFFSLLVLVVAGVLLWRARKPSARRSLVLGLAIGASLLFRSTLVFFPPVLALYEWLFRRRRSLRLYWKDLVCLCGVPYMALAPWVALNWVVLRRFVPFENGAATPNMILGALGVTHPIDNGDPRDLIGVLGGGRLNAFSSAWHQICGHPLRYAAACATRLAYETSLNPLLLLMALGALWVYRERDELRPLGLLVVYFIGVHSLMAVQTNYLAPLWPLASILAGALVDRFRPGGAAVIGPRLRRFYAAVLGAALACVLALGLLTEALVSAYAWHAAEPQAVDGDLDRAVLLYPHDAWPLLERGGRRLERGRLPEAVADLSRGLAIRPDFRSQLRLAWAKMLLGAPGPLLRWRPMDTIYTGPTLMWTAAHLLKAHAYLRLGRPAKAREELRAAQVSYKAAIFGRGRSALEVQALETLRRDSVVENHLLEMANRLLASRPAGERLAMARALAASER